MPHRLRALNLVLVVDKLDAEGQVVDELLTQPIKLFPRQIKDIPSQVAELIARLDKEEKAAPPSPPEFRKGKKPKV